MAPLSIALVDAFADRPFTGNPAGVVLMGGPDLSDMRMQSIALEMNQAETAFCWPENEAHRLRWFTPTVEVDLCGHATLATAHRLWETGAVEADEIRFVTLSGVLTASRTGNGIALDFPAEPPLANDPPANAREILGREPLWWGRNRMDHFAVVSTAEDLAGDWASRMGAITGLGMRGLIVTCLGRGEVDFVSRCFFPQSGVPEDPVTGSAHCALAPYWGARLGRSEMTGYQASPRGGTVGVRLFEDRVHLLGGAITTLVGELKV